MRGRPRKFPIGKRITTSVRLEPRIIEDAKTNSEIESLSDWVNKTYRETFMRVSVVEEELGQLKKEVEQAEKTLKELEAQELGFVGGDGK